jgi:hypothetical protein
MKGICFSSCQYLPVSVVLFCLGSFQAAQLCRPSLDVKYTPLREVLGVYLMLKVENEMHSW